MSDENQLKAKQKLQWLGLSSAAQSLSEIQGEINKIEEFYESNDLNYIDFQNDIAELENYSEFQTTYLEDKIDFTTEEAEQFIEKIKQQFETFADFQDYIQFQTSGFEDIKLAFNSSSEFTSEVTNESGEPAAGVRFHESDGTTKDNVSVLAGTTEIYGREVHFSQSDFTGDDSEEIDGEFTFDNIRTVPEDGELDNNQQGEIKVDITNSGGSEATRATLTEDGTNIQQKEPFVGNGETITISFFVTRENAAHDYQVQADTDIVQLYWIPEELEQ